MGILIPQIPTPTTSSQVTAYINIINSANAIANPKNQPRRRLCPSTIELILSVTLPDVYPGPKIGAPWLSVALG